MMDITIIPTLRDNYAYLVTAPDGTNAVIDPGEAAPIILALQMQKKNTLDYILNTHHHADHTAGNAELKKRYTAKIIAPEKETDRIAHVDIAVRENAAPFDIGGERMEILETAGHTNGHVCFYFPGSKALFSGDALFLMGCGRLFEGSARDMFTSLQKIKALPDDTLVYCGHEYTAGGAKFCLSIAPENQDLILRAVQVKTMRDKNMPTVPATLEIEKRTNVFLRAETETEFSRLRTLKDNF